MLTKSHLLCLQQPSHILIAEGYKFIIHMMIYLFLKFFWGGGVGWGGVGSSDSVNSECNDSCEIFFVTHFSVGADT